MTANSNEKRIKLWTPATYRIEVEGHLNESWSDRLAGSTMIRLRDQAELSGVLNSLYDLHLCILKVEVVNEEYFIQ